KPAALCDDGKASAGGARGGAQDAYFAPSALAGFALIEARKTGARTAGSELSIDHGLRATNRTPQKEPAKRVTRSAGFAIRSPRGMGDPHDNAPRGSQHLSSVATCSHGEPAPSPLRYTLPTPSTRPHAPPPPPPPPPTPPPSPLPPSP